MSLTYTYANNEATVSGHTDSSVTSISIPLTDPTNGYDVIAIADEVFKNYNNLTEVTIGNNVQTIGDKAFQSCSALLSLTIGNNVTSIGSSAFGYCSELTSVTIPDSVQTIGNYAFGTCSKLQSVTLPTNSNFTTITTGTFISCSALQNVTIPDSVTSIGSSAFQYCNTLTKVAIVQNSENNLTIDTTAFDSTNANLVVFIKDGTQTFSGNTQTIGGTGAFFGSAATTAFKSYIVNGTGTFATSDYTTAGSPPYMELTGWSIIGDSALIAQTALQSVTIPDSVTSIGDSAFVGCTALQSVTIPDNVTDIGNDAFNSCSALQSVIIGDSVTTIGYSAFQYCFALDSVTIGDSVTSIGAYAFGVCTALQSVTIPDNVTDIGNDAFTSCSALQSVIIGDSVTTIGDSAFQYCLALDSVTFKRTISTPVIDFEVSGGDVFGSVNASNLILYVDHIILDGNDFYVGDTDATLQGGTFANVSLASNVCFPPGTLLSLDQGDVEIQNVDTKKHTLNGKPILFVTKTAPNQPVVVCFEKDAFAPNVPSQRFECSRAHGIEFDGVRKMAEDWVDADQIHFVPNTHQFLYNLLLETHEMMDVYNIRAETLNPVRKVAQMYFTKLRKEKESC